MSSVEYLSRLGKILIESVDLRFFGSRQLTPIFRFLAPHKPESAAVISEFIEKLNRDFDDHRLVEVTHEDEEEPGCN